MTLDILTRTAKGSPLTNGEMDGNLTNIKAAVEALQGISFDGEGIANITSDGSSFTVTGTEGSVWGPFTLPRGATWITFDDVPTSGVGSNGDLGYVTGSGDIYLKSSGTWGLIDNIFGPQGPNGGGVAIDYFFSTTTTNSDPGAGTLRLNNATQTSATAIYADLLDLFGTAWTAVLDSLDAGTSTVKGNLRLVHKTQGNKWLDFGLTARISPSGYREFTVTNVAGSASNPFANNDPIVLMFTRTGDKGDTGATGVQGATGGGLSIEYTFSTTITNADPGNGALRLNNATQTSATAIYVDLLDNGGTTWTAVLDTLDASTSTVKGNLRLVKRTDATKWLDFSLTARVTQTGYRELTVSNISGSSATPFANGDGLVLMFTRNGDKGDTGSTGSAGATGSTGATGATGVQGQAGGGVSIEYTFSTTTTNSDPGAGALRVNNATQTSATALYADLLDNVGTTWTAVLDTLDASSSIVKGNLRLVKKGDATKWLDFNLTARVTQTGYRELTVTNIAGSSSSPFSNADVVVLLFTPSGDKGQQGNAAVNWQGTWSSGTTYAVDDGVFHSGSSFRSLQASNLNHAPSTASPPIDTAYWSVVAAKGDQGATGATGSTGATGATGATGSVAVNWQGVWSSGTTYAQDDGVYNSGSSFRSLQASNTNHAPSTAVPPVDTVWWAVVASKGDQGVQGNPGDGYTVRAHTYTPAAAAVTVDWSLYDVAIVTLTDSSTAFTFTGAGDWTKKLLVLIQGSGGSKLVTFSSQVVYGADIPSLPTLSTAAGKSDRLGFIYNPGSSKYELSAVNRGF